MRPQQIQKLNRFYNERFLVTSQITKLEHKRNDNKIAQIQTIKWQNQQIANETMTVEILHFQFVMGWFAYALAHLYVKSILNMWNLRLKYLQD